MSLNRTSRIRLAHEKCLPKGPNGRNICRCGCSREVPEGRRTFYGKECVDGWLIRRGQTYAASYVYKRDHGVCARCGLDTRAFKKRVDELCRLRWPPPGWYRMQQDKVAVRHFAADLLLTEKQLFQRFWEAHHKQAVSEGGGECGLDNYETLCVWCHKAETRELRRRLTEQRQAAKGKVRLI